MGLNTDFSPAEGLGLVSAAVVGIAAFLPWVTAGITAGPLELSASSTGIEGLGVLTLLLAVAVVGIVLTMGIEDHGAVLTGIVGGVIGAVGLWKIRDITGAASPGVGLYLTVVGGFGVVIGGIWAYQFQVQDGRL